jgi:hypothetical protein
VELYYCRAGLWVMYISPDLLFSHSQLSYRLYFCH